MVLFIVKNLTEHVCAVVHQGLGIYSNDANFAQNISRSSFEINVRKSFANQKNSTCCHNTFWALNRITQHDYPPWSLELDPNDF